jgi:hypothetical protein
MSPRMTSIPPLAGPPPTRAWMLWACVALACLCATLLVLARGVDLNYDLLAYHYFSGYSFLHGRLPLDVAPTDIQSYFNPLPNVLTYIAYSRLTHPYGSLLLLAVQLLSLPLLALIILELAGTRDRTTIYEAVLAFALCVASPLWLSELGTSFYSSTTAPFVLAGVWALLRSAAGPHDRRRLACIAIAGTSMGIACALKLTNVPFAIAACASLMSSRADWRLEWIARSGLAFVLGATLGFACLSWWDVEVLQAYQNPIFPFYNAIFHSPYYAAVNVRDPRWEFTGVRDLLTFLVDSAFVTSKTSEIPFRDVRLLLGSLVALAAIAVRYSPHRSSVVPMEPARRMLLCFVLVSVILWAVAFAYQRYLIPIELLGGAAIWILLRQCTDKGIVVVAGLGAILLASAIGFRVPDWRHLPAARVSNHFGLEVPAEIAGTPASYLLFGGATGYLLAFLHPDSRFYRIDFSVHVNERIRSSIASAPQLPVRLIARPADVEKATGFLARLGYGPTNRCTAIASRIDHFLVCDVTPR